jgi:hypothetical protein
MTGRVTGTSISRRLAFWNSLRSGRVSQQLQLTELKVIHCDFCRDWCVRHPSTATHEEESHHPEPCHYLPQLRNHQFTYKSHHKCLCSPNQISGPVTPQYASFHGAYFFARHYATSRKVAGSIPDEVIGFFSIYLILPAAPWPWGRLSL